MDIYTINSRTQMSIVNPWTNDYAEHGQIVYLVRALASGKVRVFTSFGHLGSAAEVGEVVQLHSQDRYDHPLGSHIVVGIINLSDEVRYIAKNDSWENYPDTYPHYVVK